MQHLEISGAVRPLYGSLGVKLLTQAYTIYRCLVPEFHLIAALRRILTEVPYCGAVLRL